MGTEVSPVTRCDFVITDNNAPATLGRTVKQTSPDNDKRNSKILICVTLPEKDFLDKIKLKQVITLCYFILLKFYFRFFDFEIDISTLKMKLNH